MRVLISILLLLPFLIGCGTNKVKVSGRVLYKGKPLPGGSVFFRPADLKQNIVTAELDEQGNYEATLPAGEVQVAVDNRHLEPIPDSPSGGLPPGLPAEAKEALNKAKPPSPPPDAPPPAADTTSAPNKLRGKYVRIPEKYYDIEASGLKFTVDPGNPNHDIELK